MKCKDCNKDCRHFKSSSLMVDKENKLFETKLYFRCPKCRTVYINVLEPKKADECNITYVGYVEKIPYVKRVTTLDNWR